ncbi:hypothetical protein [Bythopirellula polymerisocia]|uniref:PEP-CTERM protein-sorting domain-containing protein n=1 Tax=Bythopirellula polymerisocia TaxID=2528003 RepID=A0A5C6CDE7_9BACT|nr:hypothetical protein [Bythopirellula polymerisocia]TWU21396.1 hypothetical protein Pla144_46170 [Bythopirellula polymerisocia]
MKKLIFATSLACAAALTNYAQAFNQTNPLAGPADGDAFLFIDDLGGGEDGTFVAVNTGIILEDLGFYTITAATGHAAGQTLANQSIQAWSTPTTGLGDIDDREFISQAFTTFGSWTDPAEGEWADNELFFVGGADNAGEELILLLTNFSFSPQPGSENAADTGVAYWDNFRVQADTGAGNQLVWSDSFEIGLSPGSQGEVTDAGWKMGNTTLEGSGIGTQTIVPIAPLPPPPGPPPIYNFDQNNPLAAPADGDSMLFINDLDGTADNSFVAINTGIIIQDISSYEIKAATGHANGEVLANQSIQAWGTPTTGVGDLEDREFITQAFSGDGSWNNAAEGAWAENEAFFIGSPTNAGQELVILLSNFTFANGDPGDVGVAFWDNFRILEDGNEVWSDSFEIGLAPGEDAEVTDAGWTRLSASVTNSGVVAAIDLSADFNGDLRVDGADLTKWQADFGVNDGSDADGDGDTDGKDFLIWQRQIGLGKSPPVPVSAVPEPSSCLLAFLASFCTLNAGKRR